jgi:hypothetical protein
MSKFQNTKMASVIRALTPLGRNDIGHFDWIAGWAMIWTFLLASGPVLLFEKSLMHSLMGVLVVFGMLVLFGGLLLLISDVHGYLFMDSSLTGSERRGAKQLRRLRHNKHSLTK